MPKLSKRVPRYRKHRASGQAVVELNGRTHYLGPHGTKASLAEYDRLIAEWLAHGRRLPTEPEQRETIVTQLCVEYWKHAQHYYVKNGKPTSEIAAIKTVLRDVRRLYGSTPVSEFRPSFLRAVRQAWIDRGLARSTINQHCNRIRRMFRWGVGHEMVEPEILQKLEAVDGLRKDRGEARESAPILPVGDSDVETVLCHVSPIVADMLMFQRLTGCRPNEVCQLRPCDVDRSDRDVWQYRPPRHKTEHHDCSRVVFIGPQAQAILRPYLLRDSSSFCFSPAESEAKRLAERHASRATPIGYGNRPGTNKQARPKRTAKECYTTASYRRAIHRACDKAGVRRWSPNRLRHATATEIRKKHGLEAAQVVLGHTKANTTEVYAERDMELAARVAKEVG